ncbi:hypothetical protein LNKW23_17950 [Paralimibaculum aggregatum]|uniref:Uncharacterized protein n=1 Tax=Paralimibaculum aggregatum TaxID=3036245 RepID=A0ABQ6LLN2_9RHOB|nr:hypothetical protein [Limibaculum sp. NKW23]GMG82582.1 hypothetical protein LNKW23_17950 [Limibaculum sp. NKW23]
MRRLEVNICGGAHEFAAPLGFFEDVARVAPNPFLLHDRITTLAATQEEVRAVLDAALKYGGSRLRSGEVLEYEGWQRAWGLAQEALALGMVPPADLAREAGEARAGKGAAGMETAASAASA